ncbi:hypothetical protein F4808DRAFT_474963 [Astrocystis sublimbata]|nr:hypothetical protein F4808DRAFT_474963 [Astrocystis sublimbata]
MSSANLLAMVNEQISAQLDGSTLIVKISKAMYTALSQEQKKAARDYAKSVTGDPVAFFGDSVNPNRVYLGNFVRIRDSVDKTVGGSGTRDLPVLSRPPHITDCIASDPSMADVVAMPEGNVAQASELAQPPNPTLQQEEERQRYRRDLGLGVYFGFHFYPLAQDRPDLSTALIVSSLKRTWESMSRAQQQPWINHAAKWHWYENKIVASVAPARYRTV